MIFLLPKQLRQGSIGVTAVCKKKNKLYPTSSEEWIYWFVVYHDLAVNKDYQGNETDYNQSYSTTISKDCYKEFLITAKTNAQEFVQQQSTLTIQE